jgi:hypothetical protein
MLFLVVMTVALTYMNYRGLHVVGGTALSTTLFICTPFLLLCALAAPQVDTNNWVQVRGRGGGRGGLFLSSTPLSLTLFQVLPDTSKPSLKP